MVDREGATTLVTASFNNTTMHSPHPFVYISGWCAGNGICQTPTQANLKNQIHALVHFIGALNFKLLNWPKPSHMYLVVMYDHGMAPKLLLPEQI